MMAPFYLVPNPRNTHLDTGSRAANSRMPTVYSEGVSGGLPTLYTEVRGSGILRKSDAGACIAPSRQTQDRCCSILASGPFLMFALAP
jgi:hypothetical protein